MRQKDEISPDLLEMLDQLRIDPIRSPENTARGKAAFLAEARAVQIRKRAVLPGKQSSSGWWAKRVQFLSPTSQAAWSSTFSSLVTVVLILAVVFVGTGVTVAAAQASQPDQLLYSVKLLSEDLRLDFAPDIRSEYQMELDFLDRRAEELIMIFRSNGIPTDAVEARYQKQVEQAIRTAIGLPEGQVHAALEQIRVRLQEQVQTFLQVQAGSSEASRSALLRVQQMLLVRLQWVEAGLLDPQQLRDQLSQGKALQVAGTPMETRQTSTRTASGSGVGKDSESGTSTPASGSGMAKDAGNIQKSAVTSETIQGQNPWTTGTPTPGSGYGPGPGQEGTRTATPWSAENSGPTQAQSQSNQPPGIGGNPPSGPGPDQPPASGGGDPGGKNH